MIAGLGVGGVLSTVFNGGGVAPDVWCQTGPLQRGKWHEGSKGICPSSSDAMQLNLLLGGRHAQSAIALAASQRASE